MWQVKITRCEAEVPTPLPTELARTRVPFCHVMRGVGTPSAAHGSSTVSCTVIFRSIGPLCSIRGGTAGKTQSQFTSRGSGYEDQTRQIDSVKFARHQPWTLSVMDLVADPASFFAVHLYSPESSTRTDENSRDPEWCILRIRKPHIVSCRYEYSYIQQDLDTAPI